MLTVMPPASCASSGTTNDLMAKNVCWCIACYADGIDDYRVYLGADDFNTSPDNYLLIYTPRLRTEVGVSQRHEGVYDETRYVLRYGLNGDYSHVIVARTNHLRIDGLQLYATGGATNESGGFTIGWGVESTDIRFSNNIVRANLSAGDGGSAGIWIADDSTTVRIWNNIVYGWNYNPMVISGIRIRGSSSFVYNNTVYDCKNGIVVLNDGSPVVAKNNLSLGHSSSAYSGPFHPDSVNNASSSGDAPGENPIDLTGTSALDYFMGENDLHLDPSAPLVHEVAGMGVGLSVDPDLAFDTDIDGEIRSGPWDLGADQIESTGR